jgi:hypothetical protein
MATQAVMEAKKNLVRRVFQEFWNEQNEATVDEPPPTSSTTSLASRRSS